MAPSIRPPIVLGFALALSACTGQAEDTNFDVPRAAESDEEGCAKDLEYWKHHHQYASNPDKKKPWPIWEDYHACGKTWLGWVWEPSEGDAKLQLAQQFIAAMLNDYSGVAVSEDVQNALWSTMIVLQDCEMDDDEVDAALDAAVVLEAFNDGDLDAPACGGGTPPED